jgi:hypothetical protein
MTTEHEEEEAIFTVLEEKALPQVDPRLVEG